MHNSQNQENPDSNEDRQTTGFGLGQAITAAAASLRAAGTRAQELVEGTTNAVLSSLPLNRIRTTEPGPLPTSNNNVGLENQPVKKTSNVTVLALANTQSRTNLSIKGSCVILNDLVEKTGKETENFKVPAVTAGETTTGQISAGQSELPNNNLFKGSSIVKTNLQFEQPKETTKGTENLKAPAVQTPAGQSDFWNIDFFKGSFVIKTNVKGKLAKGTGNVSEYQKVPPVTTQSASGQSELPYIDFFKGFYSIKTHLHLKQAEKTANGTEHVETPTTQTTANQPESRLQSQTPIEKAGTSVEPVDHVQSNLQSTGTQTEEKNASVVNSMIKSRQRKVESHLIRQVSKTQRLEVRVQKERVPSFFTEPRLLNLASQASTTSQTPECLMGNRKTKRIVVSRQPETTFDFETDHRHTNVSKWPDINFMHHGHSSESQTTIPTSTSRRLCSPSGRRIPIPPNIKPQSKCNDLSLQRRKARRLSEVVEQRRGTFGTAKTLLDTQDSETEITERDRVKYRRSPTIPSASTPSMLPLRSESVRTRGWATETRGTDTVPNEQKTKFIKVIKELFGRCAGYRRRQ